jgi:hypothetical protein
VHREFKLQNEYPDQDYTALLRGVSLQLLNNADISFQENVWYLLRQLMSEASRDTVNIPMCWSHERQKTGKMSKQMEEENLMEESMDVWYDNIVQKYEMRPM